VGTEPSAIPIGRAIPNSRIYVLDSRGLPVPIGVPGELVVGGPGIVPGYWRRQELTEERFHANPFGEGRVYHTGDRVRWLSDGNLEFLGRADHQIKIRGYRVELGEVEDALRQNPAVRDALVLFKNGRLIAYLLAESNSGTREARQVVRSDLASRLPDYMIPTAWLWLDDFPRTPNGKIDRKTLPEPGLDGRDGQDNYVAPQTETEKKIQVIWMELLHLPIVSVKDDFFALGGHSLLLIQLVSRLRQAYALPIPLSAVVDVRTIAGQAARIDTLRWNVTGAQTGSDEPRSSGVREEFEI
jgi:acyl carrier protein